MAFSNAKEETNKKRYSEIADYMNLGQPSVAEMKKLPKGCRHGSDCFP